MRNLPARLVGTVVATRERGAARLPSAVLTRLPPPESLGPLRRAGITHVVVTTPDPGDQLVDQPGYRLLATHGPLAVYLVDPAAGSPPVRELLQPDRGTPVADGARLEWLPLETIAQIYGNSPDTVFAGGTTVKVTSTGADTVVATATNATVAAIRRVQGVPSRSL